jgi:4-amino-4-deoxy-L-arabinose transferase-like glycosyltransferase
VATREAGRSLASAVLPLHVALSVRVALAGLGIVLVLAGAVVLQTTALAAGAAIWAAGLVLLGGACWRRSTLAGLRATALGRIEALSLSGVLALAATLRLWDLDNLPNGIHIDEAVMGLIAREILQGGGPHPFGFAFIADPAPLMYVKAAFLAAVDNAIVSQRLEAAFAGLLGIVALWLLARPLFGPAVAVIATALIAVTPSHVHFSRLALSIIEIPLFGVLSAALIWRGFGSGTPIWYLLSGYSLGLAQFANFGARAYVLAVCGMLGVQLLAQPQARWSVFRGGLIVGGAMVLVLAPQLLFVRDDPGQLVDRLQYRSVFRRWDQATEIHQTTDPSMVMLGQAVINVRAFVDTPDRGTFYEHAREPLLHPLIGALFLVGILVGLWRIRQPRYSSLLLIVACVLLAGTMSAGAPQFHRLVPLTPIACLLAAITLAEMARLTARPVRRFAPRGAPAVLLAGVLLVIGVAAWDGVNGVFVRHPAILPWQPHSAWARWVAEQPADGLVLLAAAPEVRAWDERLRFLAEDRRLMDVTNPTETLPRLAGTGDPLVLGLSSRLNDWVPLVHHYLPDATYTPVEGPDGRTLLIAVTLPAGQRAAPGPGGLRGQVLVDGKDVSAAQPRFDATLAFREAGDLTAKESFEARWTGSLLITKPGRYRLEIFTDGGADLALNGETLIAARSAPNPRAVRADVTLAAGAHPLEVAYRYLRGPGTFELRWQPPGGPRSLIPPAALRPN